MDTPDRMDTPAGQGPRRRPLGALIADDLARLMGGRVASRDRIADELQQEADAARDAATRATEPPPGVRAPSRRDPVRTVPPLCGDPDHGHAPWWCAKYATAEGLRATLREADEILDEELVELPRHVHRMIPGLIFDVEAELDAEIETVRTEGEDRTEIRRRPIRRALDENLTAVRAQSLQGLHARETIARLGEIRDAAYVLAEIRREIQEADGATYIGGSGTSITATIVEDYGDGLLIRVRPR